MKKRIKRFEKKKNYISKLLNSKLFDSNRDISQDRDSTAMVETSIGMSSQNMRSLGAEPNRSRGRLNTIDGMSFSRPYQP